MEENPFSAFNSMNKDTAESAVPKLIWEGEIVSSDPLVVKVGGIDVEADEILVNASLVKDFELDCTLKAESGSLTVGSASGGVSGSIDGKITLTKTCLQEGDKVLLLSLDTQKWYLLCEVVTV